MGNNNINIANITPPKGSYWHKIADNLIDIAVGKFQQLWGIDQNKKVVKLDKNIHAWTQVAIVPDTEAAMISCSEDGIVCVIAGGEHNNEFFYIYFHSENIWYPKSFSSPFNSLSVANTKHFYVLARGWNDGPNRILKMDFGNIKILSIPEGGKEQEFIEISAGTDGTIIGIKNDGNGLNKLTRIYNYGETVHNNGQTYEYQTHYIADIDSGVASRYSFKKVAVASASQIMAVTTDNKILTYLGEDLFQEDPMLEWYFDSHANRWATRKLSGEIIKIDHNSNSDCYIIIKNGDAYTTYSRVMNP